MTPLVIADGAFNRDPVAERFRAESSGIEPDIAVFVYDSLMRYRQPGEA
jgi:hypothetical protein